MLLEPAGAAELGQLRPDRVPHDRQRRVVEADLRRTTDQVAADEVRDLVEKYLDDAFMAGVAHVRLVHGKGTGALRKAVRGVLSDHPLVASFRDGEPGEGGAGATVAVLKVS